MSTVKVSKKFKVQAYKAIMSIILFILVYFFLFMLAIGIGIGFGYLAVKFIILHPSLFSLMVGAGTIIASFYIIYFMVKFLFSKNKSDLSHLTEIDIKDEPELFKIIQELVNEIGTDFPKKVYLSPDVNASVFYDSSFWSMILPIKKNLHIGLGLVNSVTVSELKGILAHEFGHFSQKSMKVGSYVYNVNKIIHNMLFENEAYESAISKTANKSGYFALLLYISVGFNQMAKYVLQGMYKIVNINYMGLSREMEFHADEIAANIVGSKPMIDSMLRMDLSSSAFDNVVEHYNLKINESITTLNIFPNHVSVMNFLAKNNKVQFLNNLPLMATDSLDKFNKSKLIIKDQWASHPSLEERINAFEKLNIESINPDNRLANLLFKNITETQEKITKKLFQEVIYPQKPEIENENTFMETFHKNYFENKFPEIYNGYYDNYSISDFNIENLIENSHTEYTFKELFNTEKTELVYNTISLNYDLETLTGIANKNIKIKTFDYDGKKYKAKEAQLLVDNLSKKAEENNKKLEQNDVEIFKFFYSVTKEQNENYKLIKLYKELREIRKQHDKKTEIYFKMFDDFSFAYEQLEHDVIIKKMNKFKSTEQTFKDSLKSLLEDEIYKTVVTPELSNKCNDYLSKDLIYFNNVYFEEAIITKNEILSIYMFILQKSYFVKHKEILDFQSSFV
jgi:Zn-dependent protease with chaperone function